MTILSALRIDGPWVEGERRQPVRDPADGSVITETAVAGFAERIGVDL